MATGLGFRIFAFSGILCPRLSAFRGVCPRRARMGYDGHMANGLTYVRKTTTTEGTQDFAATLAPYLHEGDVVVLAGDLGAGKTQFVKGVAAGLGVSAPVTSPTFNILLSYEEGRIPLFHLDLYRLDDSSELEDIDYYALIDGDAQGATFVEWAEKFPEDMPCDYLEISITTNSEGMRTICAHSFGARARQLLFVWAKDPASRLMKFTGSIS